MLINFIFEDLAAQKRALEKSSEEDQWGESSWQDNI